MSEAPEVDRQLREKQTYNLFYSALTARASPCLADHGWRVPVTFGEIDDPYASVVARPDFVLYDGDTCLLVEVKSGNNIRDRDIAQMERCNQLTIDGVEEELEAADIRDKTPYDGEVRTIDPVSYITTLMKRGLSNVERSGTTAVSNSNGSNRKPQF